MIYNLFKTLNISGLSGTSFIAQYIKKKYLKLRVVGTK